MRCPEKSIENAKYISITIKKLYLIFLKYKQTQPACAKNEHAIDYTQNSSHFQVVGSIADIGT